MKVQVCAKLNLTLNVFERQGKFHPIDSIATTVDICDVVTVTKRLDNLVTVSGVEGVEPCNNTAYKVAVAFCKQFGTTGVDISITKGIPFGGGFGGSSADGSAVAYCMCKIFGVSLDQVADICAQTGSDLTFLLQGGLGRLTGKGDDVTYGKPAKPMYFAVTTFLHPISAAQAYDSYDRFPATVKADNDAIWSQLINGESVKADSFCNNLQFAVANIDNYASQYLAFCKERGFNPTMTGSGSGYFIPCDNEISAQQTCTLLCENGFDTVVCHSTDSAITVLED